MLWAGRFGCRPVPSCQFHLHQRTSSLDRWKGTIVKSALTSFSRVPRFSVLCAVAAFCVRGHTFSLVSAGASAVRITAGRNGAVTTDFFVLSTRARAAWSDLTHHRSARK